MKLPLTYSPGIILQGLIHVRNMPLATWTCKNEAKHTSVWSLPQGCLVLQTGSRLLPTERKPEAKAALGDEEQLLTGLTVLK